MTSTKTTARHLHLKSFFVLFTLLAVLLPVRNAFALYEAEPNDDFCTADTFRMGEVVYGDITPGCGWENDYYKVNAPMAGDAVLTFVNDHYDSWGGYNLYTYNKYHQRGSLFNAGVTFTNTAPKQFTIKLDKGINYIRVVGTDDDPNIREYHFKLTYHVAKPSACISSTKKKTIKVSWKQKSEATSYQIRYSSSKSMKGATVINVSKKSSVSSFKVPKSKTTYYVQVRTVKKANGVRYYSSWSARVAVRAK